MERLNYLDRLAKYGVQSAHPGGMALTKSLLGREIITAGMTVLDLGCGTGRTSAYIGKHYPCKIIAADIDPKMIELAGLTFAKYGLKIPLVRADATNLPFPGNMFDMVLVESVTVFTDIKKSLREYCRVLKPDGILLEVEGTAFSPLSKNETDDLQSVVGFSWTPTLEEWETLFREAGFAKVQILWRQSFKGANLSFGFNPAFRDYRRLMFRYRKKLGYGVYRCAPK